MHVPPSTPSSMEHSLPADQSLPASCFVGNPVSPMTANGHLEAQEPSPAPAVTSKHCRLPTPVELQHTRLQMNTTPTCQGGDSSVHIHQLRCDCETSMQPSGALSDTPSQIPSMVVIPPTPHNQLRCDHEASAEPSGTFSDTPGQIPSPVVIPPTLSNQNTLHYPTQYYSHYQGTPIIQPGYPQLPGVAMYP